MTPSPLRISRAQLADYRALLQKKHRRARRQFLVEGAHLIEEALASDWEIDALVISERFQSSADYPRIASGAASRRVALYHASGADIGKLSDTVTAQGAVGVVRQRRVDPLGLLEKARDGSLVVALDGVADPGNLGTIIRACDWFGADAVLLSGGTVELYTPKVVRATMGSLFHLPVVPDLDLSLLIDAARRSGFVTYGAAAQGGTSVQKVPRRPRGKVLFLLGNEAHGISGPVAGALDGLLTIPGFGKAESLNVAMTGAILLSAFRLFLTEGDPPAPSGSSRASASG